MKPSRTRFAIRYTLLAVTLLLGGTVLAQDAVVPPPIQEIKDAGRSIC